MHLGKKHLLQTFIMLTSGIPVSMNGLPLPLREKQVINHQMVEWRDRVVNSQICH